ncbi:MAG: nuclease-related domain-containing protein, partial [Lysinibacillus sp.]
MEFIRKAPAEMELYEVLLRRAIINEQVRRELQTKYIQLRTGFAGERRVDREWREVNTPGILLHDFTCRNDFGHTHQIDTIFVCKHFILVVEVKNVSGRIDFDDTRRQFLRTREDGKVESFMNPVDQVKRHRDLLVNESLGWPEYVP